MAINSCRQRGERKKKKRRNHCDVITPPITIKKTQHTHTHTHTHWTCRKIGYPIGRCITTEYVLSERTVTLDAV